MGKKRTKPGKRLSNAAFCSVLLAIFMSFPEKAISALNVVEGPLAKKLDVYLSRITPFGFSGALLVAKDGRIILNKGYGMAIRSQNVPNTSGTIFSTGSVTKQFTAAGIMKLEMMGKLKTEDPITKYFENVPGDKKEVTLHHLLTHTSGIIDALGPDFVAAPRDETMRKTLDAPLRFKPGEEFGYSNAGYSMLAAVIEKVSGLSYEEFMHENIFIPAGMKFTGYRLPGWDKKTVAHWYVGERDNGMPLEKKYPEWHLLGNGGILSTTEDMYRWHLALLEDKILSAEAKKKMFTPFLNDYGYGWDVLYRDMGLLIQHDGGSTLGSSSEMRRYIDAGVVTILFCNQSYGRETLMNAVRDKIEALVFGGDVSLPPEVRTADTVKLHKYEGKYPLSSGGSLTVRQEGGKLVVSAQGQDAVTALFAPQYPDPGYFEELNSLSVAVFEKVLEGNYEPLSKVLHEREKRFKRVKDLIEMRMKMVMERTGELKEIVSRGSLPTDFDGQKAVKTYIEFKGERGGFFLVLYWQGKKNVGVGPTPPPGEMSIPFMPLSETDFAGYRIDSGINTRLIFERDDKGNVSGLKFPGKK
ncbi:MAG: serine hydrolase [Candidatus Aminicenantes bacterium]|nr:serine hydrolase [Candidatus Aminicenantes bacterium]